MTHRAFWCCVAAHLLGLGIASADAQTVAEPTGRLQVAIGAGWLGGSTSGEQPADLRAASGGPYRLFNSDTRLAGAPSFDVRVGIALARRYGVEGRAAITTPELSTVVSSDAEATGSFTIVESIDQYLFDGGIVIRLDELEAMGLVPFAAAGAGYVRRLHESKALVEDGYLYYVGGGITHALFSRRQGLIRAVSVRADLRLNVLSLELDDDSHAQGSVSGSVVLTF